MEGTSRITLLEDYDGPEGTINSGWSNISSIHGGPSNKLKGEGRPAPEPVVDDDEIDVDMESEEEYDDKVVAAKAPPRVSSSTPKSDGNPTISIRTNVLDELEHYFAKNRTKVVNPVTGFLSTPLHCVKLLSDKFDTQLHAEVYVIHHGLKLHDLKVEDRIFRVEFLCGKARGIGQAPLRSLAYQLAAIDILEKIKYYNKGEVPEYGMPRGARVNPAVVSDLVQLCLKNGLGHPRIEINESGRPFEEVELYYCQITLGLITVKARSDSRHMARRLAALEMYNKLSNESYPEMTLGVGNECVGLKQLRELGIQPLASNTKREWLATYRTGSDGASTYFPDEEPDDGDMAEDTKSIDTVERQVAVGNSTSE